MENQTKERSYGSISEERKTEHPLVFSTNPMNTYPLRRSMDSRFSPTFRQPFNTLKSIKLLDVDFGIRSFSLSKDAEKYFRSLIGTVIVISISGTARLGKSTLLNLIVSLVAHLAKDEDQAGRIKYEDRFETQDGEDSVTESSDMFVVKLKGVNYVFLDIEGGDDPSKPDRSWYYQTLLVIAIGISQVHFFYYDMTLSKTLMDTLKLADSLICKHKIQKTHYELIKRNCRADVEQALLQSESYLKKQAYLKGIDYSPKVLRKPPEHILDMNTLGGESCVRLTSSLCSECQEDAYLKKDLLSLVETFTNPSITNEAFRSGDDVISAFENLFRVSKADLPYFQDRKSISERRCEMHREKGRLISNSLQVQLHSSTSSLLSEQIQEIKRECPAFAQSQTSVDQFREIFTNTVVKISEAESLSETLAKFMDEELLRPSFPVYDDKEKTTILQVYVEPFILVFERLHGLIISYDKVIGEIIESIQGVRANLKEDQREINNKSFNTKNRAMLTGGCLVIGTPLLILTREIVIKVIAGAIAGGAVAAAVATGVSLVQAIIQLTKIKKQIAEEYKNNDALRSIQEVDEFMQDRWGEFTEGQAVLKNLLEETQRLIQQLVPNISAVIDKKINNQGLDQREVDLVREQIEKCQGTVQWFKTYI